MNITSDSSGTNPSSSNTTRIIVIEPFYGGSHKLLIDTIFNEVENVELYTTPAKKWHWKARTSSLYFSQLISTSTSSTTTSSSTHGHTHTITNTNSNSNTSNTIVSAINDITTTSTGDTDTHTDAATSTSDDDNVTTTIAITSGGVVNSETNPDWKASKEIQSPSQNVLFTSSVLNLAELLALRPDLMQYKKVIYFHENQLQYPVRKNQDRDFQYGYNQILSCIVADIVLFNSAYNMNSFLDKIPSFLKLIPSNRPDRASIQASIKAKSQVVYYAMDFPVMREDLNLKGDRPLHIVWPHRWSTGHAATSTIVLNSTVSNKSFDMGLFTGRKVEHDKDPQTFFDVIDSLANEGLDFKISVLGEQYTTNPEVFEESRSRFSDHILHWGYQENVQDYYKVLSSAHVVVSTALHEFFGVAMLEAVHLGCYPLAPNDLVYPEHFPEQCLYNTKTQLVKKLKYFCRHPEKTRNIEVDLSKYSWEQLKPHYYKILTISAAGQ